MKRNKFNGFVLLSALLLTPLSSCQNNNRGMIIFELNGGKFSDETFSMDRIEGIANTPLKIDIPDPIKEGYTFVTWREKLANGSYTDLKKIVASDGNAYYYFPYGSTTIYAYYEPLMSISFDLTEGKSNGGKIISPVKSTLFSEKDNKLNGYTNKAIPSVDYLPKADALEMSFDYWYLKKPLKIETVDGVKRYVIDESQPEGHYRFDAQFQNESMVFPYIQNKDITLFAKWTNYPVFTVHFNIDSVEDYKFKAKNENIKDKLVSALKERLNVAYTGQEDLYYPSDSKEKRFAGFFFDKDFKNQFFLNEEVFINSEDIYLKWNKKVTVTLDYNGGLYNNKDKDIFTDYYTDDVIPEDIFSTYKPEKENHSFLFYIDSNYVKPQDDPEAADYLKYQIGSRIKDDLNLQAYYEEHPTLTIDYHYPSSYAGLEKSSSYVKIVKKEEDLSAYFKEAQDRFLSEDFNKQFAFYPVFYNLDSYGNEMKFTSSSISSSLTIYLKILYKTTVEIYPVLDTDIESSISSSKYTFSFDKDQTISSDDALFKDSLGKEKIGDDVYLPSGYYSSVNFSPNPVYSEDDRILLPIHTLLKDVDEKIKIYKRIQKAIKVTFEDESGNRLNPFSDDDMIHYVLPSSDVEDVLESYSLSDKDTGVTYLNYYPENDCTIVLKRR